MKTVGITAEYNPLHNGHVYHAGRARELAGADCVISVMSGDFTQRGEPAVCGKWERAKAAVVSAGPDLVVELPFAFACSRASVFAAGAVDMLEGLGADCISFGCETEDPELLRKLAVVLVSEGAAIDEARSNFMKNGVSSAKAYEMAVAEAAGKEAAELLLEPNNILALEYLKRILYWRSRGRDLEDIPVRRIGSGYKDADETGSGFAGAGALRKMIEAGEDVSRYVPCGQQYEEPKLMWARYLQLLKGIALRSDSTRIGSIYGVGEGMENAIVRELRKAGSTEELIGQLTSKRYTQATVRRALTHMLVGTEWGQIDRLTGRAPSAGRLLAAGEAGRRFIREHEDDGFRIVTNMNKEEDNLPAEDRELLRLDERAADIYNLLCGKDIRTASDRVKRPYIG